MCVCVCVYVFVCVGYTWVGGCVGGWVGGWVLDGWVVGCGWMGPVDLPREKRERETFIDKRQVKAEETY